MGADDEGRLRDLMPDDKIALAFDETVDRELEARLREVLCTLTPQQERVIRPRFGIGARHPLTLREVGREFGITRERVRQIEQRAMRRLRYAVRADKLKDFTES